MGQKGSSQQLEASMSYMTHVNILHPEASLSSLRDLPRVTGYWQPTASTWKGKKLPHSISVAKFHSITQYNEPPIGWFHWFNLSILSSIYRHSFTLQILTQYCIVQDGALHLTATTKLQANTNGKRWGSSHDVNLCFQWEWVCYARWYQSYSNPPW